VKNYTANRIRLISFFILFVSLFIIVRLYILQVVDHDLYIEKADKQYTSSFNIFNRGMIGFLAKDGSVVPAATLKNGFTVAVNPTILKNPEEVYEKIKDIVSISKDDFILKATKKNDPYEVIENRVSYENGKKIEELKIKGLDIYTERWRFYPGKQLASNVLGFMGFDSGGTNFVGRYGLERQYETNLSRKNSSYQNFFAQIFSNIKNDDGIKNEANVITSIEPTVQSFLEDELSKVNKTYSSEYSLGMIINPKNGEIYAMASSPSFDPNNIKDEKDPAIFKNPLVENVYEMGSIIKVLTVASGIDTGVITASTTYNDQGFIFLNNKKISNFDGKAKGIVDIQTALSQSLNVGMAFIVSRVGNERFSEYLYNFGLAEKTKIDLPNEAKNLVENLKSKRDIEHATASFGQGIALSPISTVRAISVVANGGLLIQPHIVKRMDYKVGISKEISYVPNKRVIKKETAEEVTRMLVKSVDTVLRNGQVKMTNYSIAAKTGTAQIAEGGKYSENDYLHSFVGYFPAYNPDYFIFLMTVKPKGVEYSSESLTDPFMEIVKFLINYYEVPPDR
jgi:cell division protein FtsI/penicillin-binding protein 2